MATGGITNGAQSFDGNKTFTGDVTINGTLSNSSVSQTNVVGGASGTAGSLQVYPATALKGKTSITCTNNAGNTTTTITTAEQAGARTYTVPDAGGNASFVMTAGAQTVAGDKTLSGTTAFTGAVTTTNGIAGGTARAVGGKAYAMTAAGTALTNSTDETVLGSYTLPASSIVAGSVLKIRYQGIATATNANDELTVRLRIGGTTLTGQACITHPAVDAANNNIFTGEFTLVGRAAAGAAAACVGVGSYSAIAATGGAVLATYLGSTNFATNAALLVEVTGQWSVANNNNSCRLDVLVVEAY